MNKTFKVVGWRAALIFLTLVAIQVSGAATLLYLATKLVRLAWGN